MVGLYTPKFTESSIDSKFFSSSSFLTPYIVSPFFYYVKKPSSGEKAKIKLKVKKYNPATRKHEIFIEKKLPPHSK